MFQNATCAQSVSLLQNWEMLEIAYCVFAMLQNSDVFENEVKNDKKLKVIH